MRTGQVWYSRSYEYNLDGSRRVVERNDMLHGAHRDVYAYDPLSGRLASVRDALTGEVNSFVWNPEGTLARWEQPSSHARVFGYDEEGRNLQNYLRVMKYANERKICCWYFDIRCIIANLLRRYHTAYENRTYVK